MKTKSYSLRLRLLLGTCAGVLLALSIAGWGLRALFTEHIRQQLRDHLVLQLNQISGAVRSTAQGEISIPRLAADPRLATPLSGLYWQIDAWPDARRSEITPQSAQQPQLGLLRSRSLWDQSLNLPNRYEYGQEENFGAGYSVLQIVQADGARLMAVSRLVHLPEERSPALRITVAADERLLSEPLQHFSAMLLASLVALALGLIGAAAVQVQMMLRPLREMQRWLERVRSGQEEQLQGSYPQELQPLVQEFNHVLAANAQMVQRARTQAGNLAHALNTPLSVLTNAATQNQDGSPFAALVQEQVANARRQVDYHLARARASAAVRATGLMCPIKPSIEALLRTTARLYPHIDFGAEYVVDVDVDSSANPAAFKGEEQDFFEMLGNLLDNAGKWARSQVLVRCQVVDGQIQITVEDDGCGIPNVQQREHIFKRGQRLDESCAGTGLGLHIVRELAEVYGGSVRAESAALGGLRLVLCLPLTFSLP